MEAFNADAYTFAKREKVTVAPDAPWVFETTMADPQWAIMQVSSTTRGGQAAPNAHCDIAVDGQVVVQQGIEHVFEPKKLVTTHLCLAGCNLDGDFEIDTQHIGCLLLVVVQLMLTRWSAVAERPGRAQNR